MSNLGNFYQKNKSKGFALSMETSRSFSIFAGKVKKAIEADCKDCGLSLISFHKGHYDFSGFVKRAEDGAIFYFSSFGQLAPRIPEKMMYRSARNEKDYTGGQNMFSSWDKLVDSIQCGRNQFKAS